MTSPLSTNRHDSCAPTVGKCYHGWYQLGETLKASPSAAAPGADVPREVPYKEVVNDKFDARWAYSHSSFAAAAYVVDPEFRSHDHASNEEVMSGFLDTVEKIGILLEVRRLQDSDKRYSKQWQVRKEFIVENPKKYLEYTSYPKYPDKKSAAVKVFCVKVNCFNMIRKFC